VVPTSFPAAAAACGLDSRQTMLPGLRGARALNRHRLAGAPSGCANGMLGCRCRRSPRPGRLSAKFSVTFPATWAVTSAWALRVTGYGVRGVIRLGNR